MSTERKILLIVLAVVGSLVALLFTSELVEQEVGPKPLTAWVAIEVEGSGIARTGLVRLASGTPFKLHAVVEAETFSGKTIYFTEAARLELEGREVPAESLRPWKGSSEPRILWFTVEGYTPFLEVETRETLDTFRFENHFRADWPRTWAIPGDLRPRAERDLKTGPIDGIARFGTQRYHVRVEIFGPESQITPRLRLQSLNAADIPDELDAISTVVATLPAPLAEPSRVYGLSQIEPVPGSSPEVAQQLTDWYDQGVTFSRLAVLRGHLASTGVDYEQLAWNAVELGTDLSWDETGASEGDLLRVGNRWVVLLQDRGIEGILDKEDLCLDFDKGARMRLIGEVFTGEGLVEWAGVRP